MLFNSESAEFFEVRRLRGRGVVTERCCQHNMQLPCGGLESEQLHRAHGLPCTCSLVPFRAEEPHCCPVYNALLAPKACPGLYSLLKAEGTPSLATTRLANKSPAFPQRRALGSREGAVAPKPAWPVLGSAANPLRSRRLGRSLH